MNRSCCLGLLMSLFSLACGGSGAMQSEACPYQLGDPCINEENLAQCRQVAANCEGELLVLESCPLQFACGD